MCFLSLYISIICVVNKRGDTDSLGSAVLPRWGRVFRPEKSQQYFLRGKDFLPLYFKHAVSLSLYELHISLRPYIHRPASLTSRRALPLFMNPLYHLLTDWLTAGRAEWNVVRSAWAVAAFYSSRTIRQPQPNAFFSPFAKHSQQILFKHQVFHFHHKSADHKGSWCRLDSSK